MSASIRGSVEITRSLDNTSPYEITAALPTHASGDLLLVYVMLDRGDIDASTPSGWTQVFDVRGNSLRYWARMALYKKTASSSSETDPTFTLDEVYEDSYKAVAIAVQDHNDIDVYDTSYNTSTDVDSIDCPSVTTTEDDCLVIRAVCHKNLSSNDILSGTPSTELWLDPGASSGGDGDSPGHAGSYETKASAGATGTATFTGDGMYRPVMSTVAIKSSAAATGTNMQVNIGDTWKEVSSMQINIGDSWKEVTKVQVNVGDTWKTVF